MVVRDCFLWIGTTFSVFHSEGWTPRWNTAVNTAKFANMATEKIEQSHNNRAKRSRKSAWSAAISSAILHCSTRSLRKKTQSWTSVKLLLLEWYCTTQEKELAYFFSSRETVHHLRVSVVANCLAKTSQSSLRLAQSTRSAARACWYPSTADDISKKTKGKGPSTSSSMEIPKQAWAAIAISLEVYLVDRL